MSSIFCQSRWLVPENNWDILNHGIYLSSLSQLCDASVELLQVGGFLCPLDHPCHWDVRPILLDFHRWIDLPLIAGPWYMSSSSRPRVNLCRTPKFLGPERETSNRVVSKNVRGASWVASTKTHCTNHGQPATSLFQQQLCPPLELTDLVKAGER